MKVSMDWSNERYVRLYVRDTKTWMLLQWEGQAVFSMLLRKVDRAGILDDVFCGDDLVVMFANGIPHEIAQTGFERMIKYGVIVQTKTGIFIPNFLSAQESSASDSQRKRAERERRAAAKKLESVTNSDSVESQKVTKSHDLSRGVTGGHDLSQPVTPCCADPVLNRTIQEKEEEQLALLPPSPATRPISKPESYAMDTAQKAKNVFNAVFGRKVSCTSMLSVKVQQRIKAEKLHPWQFELLPILIKAWRHDVEKTENFSLGMILRDGNHKRTDGNGRTTGGYNWLFEAYQVADTLTIEPRLARIAEHFGLTDKLAMVGARIKELRNED